MGTEYESALKSTPKPWTPLSKVEKAMERDKVDLSAKIHAAEPDKLQPVLSPDSRAKRDPESEKVYLNAEHHFEVRLEKDTFSEEKFALFRRYQIEVHGDSPPKVTKTQFTRFLCNSRLLRTTTR